MPMIRLIAATIAFALPAFGQNPGDLGFVLAAKDDRSTFVALTDDHEILRPGISRRPAGMAAFRFERECGSVHYEVRG